MQLFFWYTSLIMVLIAIGIIMIPIVILMFVVYGVLLVGSLII